jgi:hypothetical protein
MAIDSLRKRASIASLGLAFLCPSVVPDGSFVQADRQTIGHSYYGIAAGSAFVTIGGTSQLEPFTASGGITLERVIGGTGQLEPFTATGGITLERTLGGTGQLNPFTSSGGIQAGDAVEEETNTGGWFWFKYEQEQLRKQEKRRQQEEKLKKAKQIQDKIDRELALAQRELEEKELRESELKTLTVLVEQFEDEIQQLTNERISQVAQEAIEQNTYSRMERLERELSRYKEEEEFLLMATRIILNA